MDPISTKIALGTAGAGGGESYWLTYDYASGKKGYHQTVDVDSDGNVYGSGYAEYNSGGGIYSAKYSKTGDRLWHKVFTDPNASPYTYTGKGGALDSSNNFYSVAYTSENLYPNFRIPSVKYNSNGTLLTQKKFIFNGSSGPNNPHSVYYKSPYFYVPAQQALYIINESNISVSSVLYVTRGDQYLYALDIDSSGNMYIVGRYLTYSPYSNYLGTIAKVNSSGVLQWEREYGWSYQAPNYRNWSPSGVKVDSSGNIYVCGSENVNSTKGYLIKINSSGTLQWEKTLSPASSSDYLYFNGLDFDSNGDIFVGGSAYISATGTRTTVIAKYNSSGTLQFQREFYNMTMNKGFKIDANDNMYMSGTAWWPYESPAVLKLPSDGSLTGTYGQFSYQASSYTTGTPSWGLATAPATSYNANQSAAVTGQTSSNTDSASLWTNYVVDF